MTSTKQCQGSTMTARSGGGGLGLAAVAAMAAGIRGTLGRGRHNLSAANLPAHHGERVDITANGLVSRQVKHWAHDPFRRRPVPAAAHVLVVLCLQLRVPSATLAQAAAAGPPSALCPQSAAARSLRRPAALAHVRQLQHTVGCGVAGGHPHACGYSGGRHTFLVWPNGTTETARSDRRA